MTISTLVDSNILIDILNADAPPDHQEWSSLRLDEASSVGVLCLSAIAWAEVSQPYASERMLFAMLRPFKFLYEPFPFEAAFLAGQAHRRYRERGGRRERTLPDFLIGAHASVAGHRLLTHDGARYRTYFPDLDLICPETHP